MKIKLTVQYLTLIIPLSFVFVASFSLFNFMLSKETTFKNTSFVFAVSILYAFIIMLVPIYAQQLLGINIGNTPWGWLFYFPVNIIFSLIIINYQKRVFSSTEV